MFRIPMTKLKIGLNKMYTAVDVGISEIVY